MSAVPANSIASAMLRQQAGMGEDMAGWRRPAPTAGVLHTGGPTVRRPSVTWGADANRSRPGPYGLKR
jgi:hypothetical protein